MMLAIDRLKRINGSLRRLSSQKRSTVDSPCVRHMSRVQSDDSSMTCTPTSLNNVHQVSPVVHYNGSMPATVHAPQVTAYDNVTPRCSASSLTTFMAPPPTVCTTAGVYQPNLNSSTEMSVVSQEEVSQQSGYSTDPVWSHMSAVVAGSRCRESDGDVTPTNERRSLPSRPLDELNQGSVVARPAAYVVPSPKPVAMVAAKAKSSQNGTDPSATTLQPARSPGISETTKNSGTHFSYGTLPRRFSQKRQLAMENGDDLYNLSYSDAAHENMACPSRSPASVLCLEQSRERIPTDANSNCRVVKKEPPVPPKRTHSFKTDIRLPIANVRGSSGVPFTNNVLPASSSTNGEAFEASSAGNTDLFDGAENILNEVIERLERGSGSSTVRRNTGPRLGDWQDCRSTDSSSGSEDSDSGLDSRRSGSNSSLDGMAGSGGNSLADMHTLPFANENVGTIKQRGSSSSKPSVVTASDSGDVKLNSNVFTPAPTGNSSSTSSASVTAAAAS